MRSPLLAASLLLAACTPETSMRIVVESDLAPGREVDGLQVQLTSGGSRVWSRTEPLEEGDSFPIEFRSLQTREGGDRVEVEVEARLGGGSVLAAERPADFVDGTEVEVRICLLEACIGSEDSSCGEGRCGVAQDDGGVDGSGDGGGRDAADGSGGEPGPLTYVVSRIEFVQDRFCDLDGDGVEDNAVADLGGTASTLMLAGLNTNLEGIIGERGARVIFHLPWVDDASGPDDAATHLVSFRGNDTDRPVDRTDDFDGDEPFYVDQASIDHCREPFHVLEDVTIDAGAITGGDGSISIPTVAPGRRARLWGVLEPGGGAEVEACAALLISEIGRELGFPNTGNLTTLEVFLAGGEAFGIGAIPGVEPDLDLDGDGLESFERDADNHITGCIDGDRTSIPGRDCWEDPRMADAFSVNLRATAVPATLAGLAPFHASYWGSRCESRPSTSAWGVCDEPDLRACTPADAPTCTTPCGVEGILSCGFGCAEQGGCALAETQEISTELCTDAAFHWAEGGAPIECSDTSFAVPLVDGPDEVGGMSLVEPIVVGRGEVILRGSPYGFAVEGFDGPPGEGVALVAYLAEDAPFIGDGAAGDLGVNRARRGYSMEWRFRDDRTEPPSDLDAYSLRPLLGDGSTWDSVDSICAPAACERTDAAGVNQGESRPTSGYLAIHLLPDDPETETNELAIWGDDSWPEPLVYGFRCHGDECPVTIQTGDRLEVGLTAATSAAASVVEARRQGGISVTIHSPCE